jgi:hypothetical protein
MLGGTNIPPRYWHVLLLLLYGDLPDWRGLTRSLPTIALERRHTDTGRAENDISACSCLRWALAFTWKTRDVGSGGGSVCVAPWAGGQLAVAP